MEHHDAISYHQQFFEHEGSPFWAVMVAYREAGEETGREQRVSRKGKDWRLDLAPPEQRLFDALREWRNKKAIQDGRPPYVLFTNRQMAEIARLSPRDLASLRKVEGIGDSRIKNFGEEVVLLISSIEEAGVQKEDEGDPAVHTLGEDPG